MLLTGGDNRFMRSAVAGGEGEPEVASHALWWPPSKVAGRYLAPFLFDRDELDAVERIRGDHVAVEADLGRSRRAAHDPGPAQPGPIVVGVERSERSRDALALARRLARAAGTRLILVSVYPVGARSAAIERGAYARALAEEAETALDWVAAPLAGARPESRAVPCTSVPRGLQQRRGRRGRAGDRRRASQRGPLGRIVPGSVGERLLRGAPCPVAVAPRGYRDAAQGAIARIGVGYVALPEADEALRAAVGLAARTGAAVRVLSVIEPPAVSPCCPSAGARTSARRRRASELAAADPPRDRQRRDAGRDRRRGGRRLRRRRARTALPRGRPADLRLVGTPAGRQRDARQRVDRHPAQGALPAARWSRAAPATASRRCGRRRRGGHRRLSARASRSSASRWSGWAIAISARARSASERPRRCATPHSVATWSTVFFSVVTTEPSVRLARIRLPSLRGRRAQHDERLAALGVHRAAGEVGLAPLEDQ